MFWQDQLASYEAAIRAETAEKLRNLRSELAAQRNRTRIAKDRLAIDRTKRRAAETELVHYKGSCKYLRTEIVSMQERHVSREAEAVRNEAQYTALFNHTTENMGLKGIRRLEAMIERAAGVVDDMKEEEE